MDNNLRKKATFFTKDEYRSIIDEFQIDYDDSRNPEIDFLRIGIQKTKSNRVVILWFVIAILVLITGSFVLEYCMDGGAWASALLLNLSMGIVASLIILIYSSTRSKFIEYSNRLIPFLRARVKSYRGVLYMNNSRIYLSKSEVRWDILCQSHELLREMQYNIRDLFKLLTDKVACKENLNILSEQAINSIIKRSTENIDEIIFIINKKENCDEAYYIRAQKFIESVRDVEISLDEIQKIIDHLNQKKLSYEI